MRAAWARPASAARDWRRAWRPRPRPVVGAVPGLVVVGEDAAEHGLLGVGGIGHGLLPGVELLGGGPARAGRPGRLVRRPTAWAACSAARRLTGATAGVSRRGRVHETRPSSVRRLPPAYVTWLTAAAACGSRIGLGPVRPVVLGRSNLPEGTGAYRGRCRRASSAASDTGTGRTSRRSQALARVQAQFRLVGDNHRCSATSASATRGEVRCGCRRSIHDLEHDYLRTLVRTGREESQERRFLR